MERWRTWLLVAIGALAITANFSAHMTWSGVHSRTTGTPGEPSATSSLDPDPLLATVLQGDTIARARHLRRAGGNRVRVPKDGQPFKLDHRIGLATIPRSGNGWIRGLLEGSTGLATGSVYGESGAAYHNYSEAYHAECGWLKDCATVRLPAAGDPVIIKTHYPFLNPARNKTESRQAAGGDGDGNPRESIPPADVNVPLPESDIRGNISYMIVPVRNPLDNHDAWIRYAEKKGASGAKLPYLELRPFVAAWALHHRHWYGVDIPMTVYRYEDLVENPIFVLEKALKSSGLWEKCDVHDIDLLTVSKINGLRSYKRKQLGSELRKRDDMVHNYLKYRSEDIKWAIDVYGDDLERFGYKKLYEWWYAARASYDEESHDEIEEMLADRIYKLMDSSVGSSSWNEDWRKPRAHGAEPM